MSTPTDPSNQLKSDFMAAEEIKGILSGREKGEQERIIRWVTESLGVSRPKEGIADSFPRSPAQPAHVADSASSHIRGKDVKAFVEEKKPKNDVQFATVVAYYHRFEVSQAQRKESITAADLQDSARIAGRDRFSTPRVPLNNAATLGYLDRAGGGAFRINAVGENLVAMSLPGIEGKRMVKRGGKKKPKERTRNSKGKA